MFLLYVSFNCQHSLLRIDLQMQILIVMYQRFGFGNMMLYGRMWLSIIYTTIFILIKLDSDIETNISKTTSLFVWPSPPRKSLTSDPLHQKKNDDVVFASPLILSMHKHSFSFPIFWVIPSYVWYSTNFKLKKPGIRMLHVTQHTVCQTPHPSHKQKHHVMLMIKQQFPVVPSRMDTSNILLSISLWTCHFSQ